MHVSPKVCRWVGAALAAVAVVSTAAFGEELWEAELRAQLEQQQGCELNFLTGVEERMIDGVDVTLARAHCLDKRSFDVRRPAGEYEFEIVACEPTYC